MKKILIIEDSDDIREGTAEILELAGYKPLTAKNGKIGVDLAIKEKPDVILCDIMMPELDGYGVLYLLQKNKATVNIPFIFITAKAERSDWRKGMEMGADDYITKPFDDIELFSAIESRIKKRQISSAFKTDGLEKQLLLEELTKKGRARTLTPKQVIYVEGDDPEHLFFVKSGQIKTYKRTDDDRELLTGFYVANDFFGFESICKPSSYKENASTLGNAELLMIAKADFNVFLNQYAEVSSVFMAFLTTSLHEKEDRMLKLAFSSVRKRVAEGLVYAAEKLNTPSGDSCVLKISRDDLAALVGTASETISRVLADFKEEKLIEKQGNAIQILSVQQLKKVKQ